MDEVIWVEILSRHRGILARHRFAGPEIRIGRGYANDLVLDDPFVAAQHLRVRRDESGALIAEDIGSANGMFVDRGRSRADRVVLDGERVIRIGHSYLRVRDASHPTPRERPLSRQSRSWPAALGLIALVLALETLLLWLAETSAPKLSHYLSPLLGVAVAIVVWAAIWAILCRIFSGQAQFERHLLIAVIGGLALSLSHFLTEAAAFAFSWYGGVNYGYVANDAIVAAVCFSHLRVIGLSRLKIKAGAVAAIAAVAILTQMLTQSEARADFGQQDYARRLFPPAFRLRPPHEEGAFFADVERLKEKIDHDRTHAAGSAPPGVSLVLHPDD